MGGAVESYFEAGLPKDANTMSSSTAFPVASNNLDSSKFLFGVT